MLAYILMNWFIQIAVYLLMDGMEKENFHSMLVAQYNSEGWIIIPVILILISLASIPGLVIYAASRLT